MSTSTQAAPGTGSAVNSQGARNASVEAVPSGRARSFFFAQRHRMSPERKVVVLVQLVLGGFLAGTGFVLAHLQREVLAISQTDQAPVWLWFIWIGYAATIALFAFACADRPE